MSKLPALAAIALLAIPVPAHAWEFRARFIERVGTTNLDLPNNTIDASSLLPRRIRIQFGVFDDADSPAPAGGFVGWNVGTISVSGPADNSDDSRTLGRLAPFNFPTQPGANGNPPLPDGDPFTTLTDIDATLGTHSPLWICTPDGQVPPMPPAFVRGRNAFVSVFELTIDPRPGASSYTLDVGGNLIACLEWRVVGTPRPPECPGGPCPGKPCGGYVAYAPVTAPPEPFTATLHVVVPSPASAPILLAALALAVPRRRS